MGENVRRLRLKRGFSLDRLARASGLSRPALEGIESGGTAPTIDELWKVARALGVPFSALVIDEKAPTATVLPRDSAKVLSSADGSFRSRALFPFNRPRVIEFYELKLGPRAIERAEPHPPGTTENLVVATGALELEVDQERHRLGPGDAILFDADVPHEYRNPGDEETSMYLVMTYAERVPEG